MELDTPPQLKEQFTWKAAYIEAFVRKKKKMSIPPPKQPSSNSPGGSPFVLLLYLHANLFFLLIIFLTLSHHSLHLFWYLMDIPHRLWHLDQRILFAYLTKIVKAVAKDIFFYAGVPFLSFWMILLTIYRVPALIHELAQRYNTRPATEAEGFSGVALSQGYWMLSDVLIIPLLVTGFRVPSLFRRLSGHSYCQLMGSSGGLYQEVRREYEHVYRRAVALGQNADLVWKPPLSFILCLLVLSTLSYHPVVLLKHLMDHLRMAKPASKRSVGHTIRRVWQISAEVAKEAFGTNLVMMLGLPYFCFWLVLITAYRLPLVLRHAWNPNCTPTITNGPGPFASTAAQPHICSVTQVVMDQACLVVKDLFSLVFTLLPILCTGHRLCALWRRCRRHSYEELMEEDAIHDLLLDECQYVGTC